MSSTEPGRAGTSVNPTDLRADAEVWREQSTALAGLGITILGLALDVDKLGVFSLVHAAHNALTDTLSAMCAADAVKAERTSGLLTESADAYERADDEAGRHIGKERD